MRNSIFALPALLRPALLLAAASPTSFSVQDDLLAFPQYEVQFSEDYLSESQAHERLHRNNKAGPDSAVAAQVALGSNQSNDEDEGFEYEQMVLDGQRYLCSIPHVTIAEDAANVNETQTRMEEAKELQRATNRGWELLSGMEGNCVFFISGWWSYKFCYNDGVRQFHQLPPSKGVPQYPPIEDPGVEGFTLGTYSQQDEKTQFQEAESSSTDVAHKSTPFAPTELVSRGDTRYLVQRLDGGTKCDLTGKDRRVEVQFHCNPQSTDRITLIKEVATCAYLMVIQTPRLCSDIAFMPPQTDKPHAIMCSPILAQSDVAAYKRDLKALKAAEREAQVWQADPAAAKAFFPQIVGGIQIGGHDIVPRDVKLEKSAVVGGGKETYIDTVASSDGKQLSKEEIEKLGLGDAKAVEELRKRLESIAKGQEWKLDVIDTPRGREYRGVIGNQDEEDGKKDGKGDDEKGKKKKEGSEEEHHKDEL